MDIIQNPTKVLFLLIKTISTQVPTQISKNRKSKSQHQSRCQKRKSEGEKQKQCSCSIATSCLR